MLIHHTQDPQWMADAYVVAKGRGGPHCDVRNCRRK